MDSKEIALVVLGGVILAAFVVTLAFLIRAACTKVK